MARECRGYHGRQNDCTRVPAREYHGVMPHRDLNVLDAADRAADLINALIDRAPRGWLLHVRQMRDSVQGWLLDFSVTQTVSLRADAS